MSDAMDSLENMNHAAHAREHEHHKSDQFATYAGITMAILGVLLAFASAKVGGERTELVKSMVEQQDAHMRYITQDIKHRVAVLGLYQMRGMLAVAPAAPSHNSSSADGEGMVRLADSVRRYLSESKAAAAWSDAYDPAVRAHVEGQEYYELGMLASEIGIVVASVALLLRRRLLWYAAIALGVVSVGIMAFTYVTTSPVVHESEKKIDESARAYRDLRAADKTTAAEEQLVQEVLATYGKHEPRP
jgi:hypothetical protein